jgi:hypothetical protein
MDTGCVFCEVGATFVNNEVFSVDRHRQNPFPVVEEAPFQNRTVLGTSKTMIMCHEGAVLSKVISKYIFL